MKTKKVPLRVCAGCQEQKRKKNYCALSGLRTTWLKLIEQGKNRAAACTSAPIGNVWTRRIKNIGWNGR